MHASSLNLQAGFKGQYWHIALGLFLTFSLLTGCASVHQPTNLAITEIDEKTGYRRQNSGPSKVKNEDLVLLSFSGGGTRAAALSYGVMLELRDTLIDSGGTKVRLLDEVDTISSVSGGSFTAAYYGVYRDELFDNFEEEVLRKNIQSVLTRQLFNPINWLRGADRTERAVEYYEKIAFKGATFDDMARNGPPFIDINATDLSSGFRFTFSQDQFDLICTDLGSISVARAVTASSAVPVVFPPVVLTNHADQCDINAKTDWRLLQKFHASGEEQARTVEVFKSYRDFEQRRYIHLVDGGVSDNLGLRALLDRFEFHKQQRLQQVRKKSLGNILIVLVDAETKSARLFEQSPKKPSIGETMSAYSSAQIGNYNIVTRERLREVVLEFDQHAAVTGASTETHFAEVSFEQVKDPKVRHFLNSLPTSLELDDGDVDRLVLAGRILLRNDPAFRGYVERVNGSLADGAPTTEQMYKSFSEGD